MTHAELLAEVLQLAAARGVPYIVAHGARSTPGATDLVLVGQTNWVAFVELKNVDGRRSRAQIAFADRIDNQPFARYFLWRPADLESGKIDTELVYLSRGYDS